MVETCASTSNAPRATLPVRFGFAVLGLFAVLVAACGNAAVSEESNIPEDINAAPTVTSSTTEAANRPPEIRVATVGRAEIGERLTEPIIGFDPDGDDVVVTTSDAPLGFSPTLNTRGRVTGFVWEPVEPGEWTVEVTGTDPDGASTSTEVLLISRNPRSVDLLLALGDSIAAGFGRDRSDFLGSDACFRSEDVAYGLQTHIELTDVGALGADGDALLVACADATTEALMTTPVDATTPSGDRRNDVARSQLQWAIDLNPTIVTLTVGAADLGLFDAEVSDEIVAADFDATQQQEEFASSLHAILGKLVTATDAHIALTTYYDPTAAVPTGVDGCRAACFATAFGDRIRTLNDLIVDVSQQYPESRVSVVRLDGDNDVWEAGNALGPDALRDGLGPLQGLVDRFTGGGAATCAQEGAPDRELVSGLDCLHPNTEGHAEIRRLVVETLLSL